MRRQRPSNRTRGLAQAVVVAVLVVLAAVACNGDGTSPAGGSPAPDASPSPEASPSEASPSPDASPSADATATPSIPPGSGRQPIDAITSYIAANGLDGQELSVTTREDCDPQGPLATPGVTSTLALGQFCIIAKDLELEKAVTIVLDLPDTGETWEMKLEFDAETSLWEVKEVDKTSG